VRYETTFRFQIEKNTEALILKDIQYLDTLSPDRLRNELELCLEEEQPEKVLLRASEMGILQRLAPSLRFFGKNLSNYKKRFAP